jgi:WD40 repeat protein
LQAWELPGGKLKARFSHQQDFNAVRVSDDGSLVATLSEGRVYLWDSATGEPVSQLLDVGYVRDVRFSPDGRRLLIASDDGTASLWLWKTGDLKDEACKRLPRNLSEEEWRRYMGALPYHTTCPNLPRGR